ncbi:MAG: bifunctional 5,10-methylenetetrahydrofolate dehydrogenase/5,10-methenyltetrahydrofolate cyclohydrolase [Bacilli bacterium]|nr:bifunctional 5,10-methylenetetrahydrofolate dehydrogenase/5,10-methenyltetrahydrofolate cyclohydrolase [Bacilli bacterium]
MMNILDGKVVRKSILENIKEELKDIDKPLGLAVISVGEDEASKVYIRQKEKMAKELGYNFKHYKFDSDVEEKTILRLIDVLNINSGIDGILVQMPLPEHLDSNIIQNRIDFKKDVDGLTDINAGKLIHNKDCLIPCTPLGIIEILKYYDVNIDGANIVVVGRSNLVGKPLSNLLINHNATVTLCHSHTKNLKNITKNADILIAAIGKPNFITSDMIKDNAVIIDVGINRVDDKLCGDVDYNNVKGKVKYITPVPGGVGQMTVAMLGYNVKKAHTLRKKR